MSSLIYDNNTKKNPTTIYQLFLVHIVIVLLMGCADTYDDADSFSPTLSGKIVIINESNQLYVIDAKTKKSTPFGTGDYSRPIWSYDGTKFAAFEEVNNSQTGSPYYSIKVVNTQINTTTNWEIGKNRNAANGDLTWSPDGATIAFLNGNNINYLNTLNGDTTITSFTLADSLEISAISWHPGGDKIALCVAYSHWNYFLDSTSNSIYLIKPYAKSLQNISPTGVYGEMFGNCIAQHLDWNFDGTMLLLSREEEKILIMNVTEGEIKPIPDILGNSACWSNDGEYILFQKIRHTSWTSGTDNFYITTKEGKSKFLLMERGGFADWY